jgi:tRNA(Ile)-lysidine synthase
VSDALSTTQEDRDRGGISRNHPVAARILRRWRELTGGKSVRDTERRAVVACSGGADSVALALVLSLIEPKPILGHVVHDIRDDGSAIGDRDTVAGLARTLGCGFVERRVEVAGLDGNLEHNARVARYRALSEIAEEVGVGFIATGHHSDDQLETMLMHLMRGTGVRGMGGVSPIREMGAIKIARPMLEVTRADIEGLCTEAGHGWRHDHTNDDLGYLRNRVRSELIPVLRKIEPEIALRASGLADSCRATSGVVEQIVRDGLVGDGERTGLDWSWSRQVLRGQPEAVLAELMFVYVREVLDGVGADTINRRVIEGVVRAIKSEDTDPHVHRVGPIVVDVDARKVAISVAGEDASQEGTDYA